MPELTTANPDPVFVTHPVFQAPAFGTFHPLSIGRHRTLVRLCEILGWLDEDCMAVCELPGRDVLERFHSADYLETLEAAATSGKASTAVREKYGLGTAECPLFDGLWDRARATVGGSILAAQLALGGARAFHPAGGTHHGRPDRASGFCYLNDPVFAILTLLDSGMERVLYADLDAHHGDGVQSAFEPDRRVFTVSIHEAGRWPNTGTIEDRGRGNAINLPVPRGFNDSELALIMREAVMPVAKSWSPQAVVVTCGADALKGDPLSGLELSNGALCAAAMALVHLTPHAVLLGGGGYNPWTTARAWARLWGEVSGRPLADMLPGDAQELMRRLNCDLVDDEDIPPFWLDALNDPANEGPVRPEIREIIRKATA